MKISSESTGKGGHWYALDGTKRYGATLREARTENLLPSPTEVLKTINDEGLDFWKMQQTVKAVIELPREVEEDEKAYTTRINAKSEELRSEAQKLGSAVHNGIEQMIAWRLWDETCPILNQFHSWAKDNIKAHEWAEQVLVNPTLGVAGTADALIYFKGEAAEICGTGPVLVDWKTQRMKLVTPKTKPAYYKPVFYDKWVMQLAFYQSCELVPPPVVSVAINTSEPQTPYLKLWSDEEVAAGMEAFKAALTLWQYKKNYKPNTGE